MRKHAILLILVALVLFASPTSGQQHALTQQQCQADAAAWGPPSHDLFTLDLTKPNVASFGVSSSDQAKIEELNLRVQEMEQCKKIDVALFSSRTYDNVEMYYVYVTWRRMHDFLIRHNLRDQFLQEDREGKR
jgi:hypothetical protein